MSGQPMTTLPGQVPTIEARTSTWTKESTKVTSMPSRARTIRAVFADATDGYAAVQLLRETGFRIDLAGAVNGDLVVTIQTGSPRLDEIAVMVAAHHGRIDTG